MRIVAEPDGVVDRIDRSLWLTVPFDLLWSSLLVPSGRLLYRHGHVAGTRRAAHHAAGTANASGHVAGSRRAAAYPASS